MNKFLPLLVFRCVALGLGLGVLTLLGMDKIATEEAIWLLALAVTCLAACSLGENSKNQKKK
ncbi:MAG: hypothetical protein IJW01_06270 [Paludibacteraceae bacterium]|nr:hypothetical protein [Paludibacteraceae bacterium]